MCTSGMQSKILPADHTTQLPTSYGVTARYIDDAANGVSAGALTAPPAGQLTDVALFIDEFSQNLGSSATTKQIVIGFGGGWGGGEPSPSILYLVPLQHLSCLLHTCLALVWDFGTCDCHVQFACLCIPSCASV